MILAEADDMGGFALWVGGDGLLRYSYFMMAVEHYQHRATEALPTGDVTVRLQFDADSPGPGSGGNVTLWANGQPIGQGRMDRTVALRFSFYAGMDIGRDNGMTVDTAYRDKAPYPFTGTIKKVVFDLKPASIADEKSLHETAHHAAVAAGMAG